MDKSVVTYKVSFYKHFSRLFIWTGSFGFVFFSAIQLLTGQENAKWVASFLSGLIGFFIMAIITAIGAWITGKKGNIEISPSGIKGYKSFGRSNFICWDSIIGVKFLVSPGYRGLTIYDKNNEKTHVTLDLERIEQFRSDVTKFAGVDNPFSQTLEGLHYSAPRIEPNNRSSQRKRIAISIPIGIVFLSFAGFMFIFARTLADRAYKEIGLIQGMTPEIIGSNCFHFTKIFTIWIFILGPITLIVLALIPSSLVFFSFRKRIIFASMIFCVFGSIAYFVFGFLVLYILC